MIIEASLLIGKLRFISRAKNHSLLERTKFRIFKCAKKNFLINLLIKSTCQSHYHLLKNAVLLLFANQEGICTSHSSIILRLFLCHRLFSLRGWIFSAENLYPDPHLLRFRLLFLFFENRSKKSNSKISFTFY